LSNSSYVFSSLKLSLIFEKSFDLLHPILANVELGLSEELEHALPLLIAILFSDI
tara:strand:- start:82 stop:246 length:165 start_codon:yes stop_codon:yes gene_type:complete